MNILFLGGDKRYKFMMCNLAKKHSVHQIGFSNMTDNIYTDDISKININDFDVILFPISGINDEGNIKTENGMIHLPDNIFSNLKDNVKIFTGLKTQKLLELIPEKNIVSFLDFKEVEEINNDLTVEGVIADIKDKVKDIVCILGYGKLGKKLYLKFLEEGIQPFVISRPKELIYTDKIKNYYPLSSQNVIEIFKICDMVINTIPYNIIPEEALIVDNKPYILDIASYPYGIDSDIVKKYNDKISYKLYLGIPSIYAPKEASEILLKVLEEEINI